MKNLEELEKKYAKLGKKIEALKIEHKYPIYCLAKSTGLVAKFTSLNEGVVVKQDSISADVGYKFNDWEPHTNTRHWQQLDVCPYTGFYDGQLIWGWGKNYTHSRYLVFFDVKNCSYFNFFGKRDNRHKIPDVNYEPYEGNWTEWALKAFKTLEK